MRALVRGMIGALLAVGLTTPGFAQEESGTGTVVGRVMWCDQDTATERPASNTLVVAEGTFIGTRTDDAGNFTLRDVPAEPGQIIEALSDDEQIKAARLDVPVTADRTLDIGDLELGAPVLSGCIPAPDETVPTGPDTPTATEPVSP
jgi:hypothetical protein